VADETPAPNTASTEAAFEDAREAIVRLLMQERPAIVR
jgi:hypothetical protein